MSLFARGCSFTIVEVIDQWYGPGYRYVKVKGYDRNVYILRFDQIRDSWELGSKLINFCALRIRS